MKILAFEFSSEQRSVAIGSNVKGSFEILGHASETGGRSTRAIGLIEKVLTEARLDREQIECIAMGIGPGSYTGIRAGIALAQGWQLATNVKTLGISSVGCLAAQAQVERIFGRVNIIVDAQRNEFYLAAYEISETRLDENEKLHLVSAEEVKCRAEAGGIIMGPEANIFGGRRLFPDAAMLAKLAAQRSDFIPAAKLEPIYLREVSFVKAPPPRIIS